MIGSLRCMNGTWTEAECVPSPGADPPSGFQFADEALGACRNSQHGAQCQLFCKHGYEVHEPGAKLAKRLHSATVVCNHGSWQGAECQPSTCWAPPPHIHHATGLRKCINVPSGGVCHADCKPGYDMTGTPVCVEGVWNTTGIRCE